MSVVKCLTNLQPIKPTEPHVDILLATWTLISECAYNINLVFVKGHQDMGYPTALTRDAWLNVKANLLAKNKLSKPYAGPVQYCLPGNPWSCYTGLK